MGLLLSDLAPASAKSGTLDCNFSEQRLNLARLEIVHRPLRPASRANPISQSGLINLTLGDPRLNLFDNGLAFEQR